MANQLVEAVSEKMDVAAITSLAEVAMEKAVSFSIQLVLAIALLLAGLFLARIGAEALRTKLSKIRGFDPTLVPILVQILRYAILVITFVLVLSNFGIETTSIIAVLGAAGLAIGLALQGTLQNVAAGIMLLIIRPFRTGDFIEAASISGKVNEIGLFITRMTTSQGVYVAVPNSKLWSDVIVNYNRNPTRRLDLQIGISYDDNIDDALALIRSLVENDKRVMEEPEPLVVVRTLGDSSVNLEIRAWVKREDYWAFNFDLTRAAKLALDEAGISIPYPHSQIVLPAELAGKLPGGNGGALPGAAPDVAAQSAGENEKQPKKRPSRRKKPGSTAV